MKNIRSCKIKTQTYLCKKTKITKKESYKNKVMNKWMFLLVTLYALLMRSYTILLYIQDKFLF